MKSYSSVIFVIILICLGLVYGGQYRWVSTYRKPYVEFPDIENNLTAVDSFKEKYLDELKKGAEDLNADLSESYSKSTFYIPIKRQLMFNKMDLLNIGIKRKSNDMPRGQWFNRRNVRLTKRGILWNEE